jgi:hypothetical protein
VTSLHTPPFSHGFDKQGLAAVEPAKKRNTIRFVHFLDGFTKFCMHIYFLKKCYNKTIKTIAHI